MKTELFLEMQIRRYYANNRQSYMVMPILTSQEYLHQSTTNMTTD